LILEPISAWRMDWSSRRRVGRWVGAGVQVRASGRTGVGLRWADSAES
jgi:hypothetical protein